MDNHQFRSLLIQIESSLKEDDRQRLHFFLGDDVPRRIRDDSTLRGTLSLMESLLERDKINESDFSLLINTFHEIKCHDIVKILQDHQRRFQREWINGSTRSLGEICPSLVKKVIDDQPDAFGTAPGIEEKDGCVLRVEPTALPHLEEPRGEKEFFLNESLVEYPMRRRPIQRLGSKGKKIGKRLFKYIQVIVPIALVIIVISTAAILHQHNKNENAKLKKQIYQCEKEQSDLMIKAGKKFGSASGLHSFDDSRLTGFTSSHYFHKLEITQDPEKIEIYQFFYTRSGSNDFQIQSLTYGKVRSFISIPFTFRNNALVNRVEGEIIYRSIPSDNGKNVTVPIITGLQFFSGGIPSLSYNGPRGHRFKEEFPGFYLGYIRGNYDRYIHEIQFVWFRNTS